MRTANGLSHDSHAVFGDGDRNVFSTRSERGRVVHVGDKTLLSSVSPDPVEAVSDVLKSQGTFGPSSAGKDGTFRSTRFACLRSGALKSILSVVALLFLVAVPPVFPRDASADEDNLMEFSFSNFDVVNLVKLMSKLTNRTFLYKESEIQGRTISLISPDKYTPEEAFAIFEAIMEVNGLTTIKYDNFYRIVTVDSAKRQQTEVVEGEDGAPDYVTRIIKLKHVNVAVAQNALTPFVSSSTNLVQYAPANTLILKDTKKSSEYLIRLLELIDQEGVQPRLEKIVLKDADINQTQQLINQMFASQDIDPKSRPVVVPEVPTNSLVILALPKTLAKIREAVAQIDQPRESLELQIFQVVHAKVSNVSNILNSIFRTLIEKRKLTLVPDPSSNRLVVTTLPETLEKIGLLIKELDQAIPLASSDYRVFRLNNANAKEIAPVLQQATGSISQVAKASSARQALVQAKQAVESEQPAEGQPENAEPSEPVIVVENVPPSTVGQEQSKIAIIADEASNSIVVYAGTEELPVIEKLIKDLDVVRPQVFVETLIVEMSLEKSLNLGVDWKTSQAIKENGNTQAVATFSNARNANPSTFVGAATSAPEGTTVGILGKAIPFGDQSFSSFSAFVQATQTDSEINILSNPKILTLNNKEAEIKVGEVRPFQTELKIDSNGAESRSFEYKEVGVSLKITPQINPDGTIKLAINQSTKEIRRSSQSTQQSFTPTTLERTLNSNVVVNDSEIIVLGGLISDSVEVIETKTPCLGDIPFMGWLFKSRINRNTKNNLLVFFLPRIVNKKEDLQSVSDEAREDFIQAERDNFKLDLSNEFGIGKSDAPESPFADEESPFQAPESAFDEEPPFQAPESAFDEEPEILP